MMKSAYSDELASLLVVREHNLDITLSFTTVVFSHYCSLPIKHSCPLMLFQNIFVYINNHDIDRGHLALTTLTDGICSNAALL